MTCRELADFILEYSDGTLPREVRARFAHHLTLCRACVNYLAAYQATVALGREAFEDGEQPVEEAGVPEGLVRGILSAIVGSGGSPVTAPASKASNRAV